MTNKEKIEILLKMRERIEGDLSAGFCNAYALTINRFNPSKPTDLELNDIGLFKPEKPYNDTYWYDTKDKNIRIKKINEAIASFEQPTLETLEAQKAELEKRIAEMKSDKIDLSGFYIDKGMFSCLNSEVMPFGSYQLEHYPSRHTAEKALLMIKLIQIAYILNGGDWSAENGEAGYILVLDRSSYICRVTDFYGTSFGTPQFKTRELAEKAMKQFTNDELKKLLS